MSSHRQSVPGYYTIAEAARILGVSTVMVGRYVRGKASVKLPAVRATREWLIPERALEEFHRPPGGFPKHPR